MDVSPNMPIPGSDVDDLLRRAVQQKYKIHKQRDSPLPGCGRESVPQMHLLGWLTLAGDAQFP